MLKSIFFQIIYFSIFTFILTACTVSEVNNIESEIPTQHIVSTTSTTVIVTSSPVPSIIATSRPSVTPTSIPSPAPASSLTPTPEWIAEIVTIPVSADTYIYSHPNTSQVNYGQESTLILGGDSDANFYKILLDFDIENYIPKDAKLVEANLYLVASDNVSWGFPFTIHQILTLWDENTVTSDSQPMYDESPLTSQILDESNTSMIFPVTDIVHSWLNGDSEEYGFLLFANVIQNTARFFSKEGSINDPIYLEVAFEALAGSEVSEIDNAPFSNDEDALQVPNISDTSLESLPLSELKENGHIIFETYPDFGGANEIHIINADGSGERTLVIGKSPDLSPDGTQVAYEHLLGGSPNIEIVIFNMDGSDSQQITTNEGEDINPLWSPTGDEIAYIAQGENSGWYVFNFETGEARKEYPDWVRLTAKVGPFAGWKANSCRIELENGGTKLDICLEKGDEVINLTKELFGFNVLTSTNPWSPDGRFLVADDGFRLYVIEVETGRYAQLPISQRARDAHWGPDRPDGQ